MDLLRSVAAVCAALFLCRPSALSAGASDGLSYTVRNGMAVVTGYTGEPAYLEIPQFAGGYQVALIDDGAFSGCSSLKQISLPDGLLAVGEKSFYACSQLESIVIPDSVITLGAGCFCGCGELRALSLPEDIRALPDSCFRACVSLTDLTIPDSVGILGSCAFSGCSSLGSVRLGSALTEIGSYAFYMCPELDAVCIPDTVTSLGEYAFGYSSPVPDTSFMLLSSGNRAAKRYADENSLSYCDTGDAIPAASVTGISGRRLPPGIPLILLMVISITFPLLCIRLSVQNRKLKKRKY